MLVDNTPEVATRLLLAHLVETNVPGTEVLKFYGENVKSGYRPPLNEFLIFSFFP
jgi:hypothetical protein